MASTAPPTADHPTWDRCHLTGLADLSAAEITALLDRAHEMDRRLRQRDASLGERLRGRIIANVFLEDSTRTRSSFSIATQRLGGTTIAITDRGSSVSKGETVLDTALTIAAMRVDAMVVRTRESGFPRELSAQVDMPVINAGDGNNEHPTQGLLDALTLRERLGDLRGKQIAIVGDIANSRVAGSNMHCLPKLGMHVTLVGPSEMCPDSVSALRAVESGTGSIRVEHDLDAVLSSLDAIMMLRVQFERGSTIGEDYRDRYALTDARADRLPAHAIVMHPGPVNRELELDSSVMDHPDRSTIFLQVRNGVPIRMAVLDAICGAD